MKWQIPCDCAKQATGLDLSILAASDFAFAGDRGASIDERLAKFEVRILAVHRINRKRDEAGQNWRRIDVVGAPQRDGL
jgi:hypothetical protein